PLRVLWQTKRPPAGAGGLRASSEECLALASSSSSAHRPPAVIGRHRAIARVPTLNGRGADKRDGVTKARATGSCCSRLYCHPSHLHSLDSLCCSVALRRVRP